MNDSEQWVAINGDTGEVTFSQKNRPHIQRNHIDGPLLYLRDGRLHWLTLKERFLLWIGGTDAYKLERKYWNASSQQLMEGI
ncbi:MAG: hypothetical protein ACM3SS_01520 [Rhodospirillaceae bacterium]